MGKHHLSHLVLVGERARPGLLLHSRSAAGARDQLCRCQGPLLLVYPLVPILALATMHLQMRRPSPVRSRRWQWLHRCDRLVRECCRKSQTYRCTFFFSRFLARRTLCLSARLLNSSSGLPPAASAPSEGATSKGTVCWLILIRSSASSLCEDELTDLTIASFLARPSACARLHTSSHCLLFKPKLTRGRLAVTSPSPSRITSSAIPNFASFSILFSAIFSLLRSFAFRGFA